VLCRLLEREGLEVRVAGNGTAALEMLVEAAPDVILLDVQMPGPSGFEVCATIKGNPETRFIPVILITGLGRVEDRIRGIEVGADDFIVKPFDRHEVVARVRSLSRVKRATDGLERAELVLLALARSIEGRDPYTQGHCERLSRYATALGDRLGLPTPELVALERAGTTHDIGKVAVPDAILLKKGPLTDEEWTVMRQHPVTGEHICKPIKSFKLVRPIIRHHHERLDGSGYPDGLMGDNIPLTARVLSVVDVFDALTTRRSYKHAMRTDDALEVMATEGRKGWLDREIVPEFRDLVLQGGLLDAVTAGNPA
jgi:putative two-component system response regulator